MTTHIKIKTEECLYTIAPEWDSPSDYSVPVVAAPHTFSPSYTEVPVSNIARGPLKLEQQPHTIERYKSFVPSMTSGRDYSASQSPSTPSNAHVLSPAPSEPPVPAKRIPRPPNAFMLFRSDFLKKGHIPKDVEKRQQNLSRIVGQIWTMMDNEEKLKWHRRAHDVQQQHQAQNPDYKFVPAPRGSRRAKDKVHADEDSAAKAEERTQQLREMYTGFLGPSPPSARKRRPKKARSVGAPSPLTQFSVPRAAYPISALSSAPSTNAMRPAQIPPSTSVQRQEPFYTPLYVPRRPSTSLGFNENSKQDFPSYQWPLVGDMSTGFKRPAESSMEFFERIHIRGSGQNIKSADMRSGGEAATSVPAGFDASQWGSYSMAKIPPHMEAKFQSPIHPQLVGPFSPPSLPSSARNFEAISPTGHFSITPDAEVHILEAPADSSTSQPVDDDDDDDAFFASFGFSDDMLSYLKTPFDDSAFTPVEASHDQCLQGDWQPAPSTDLAKWEFDNLYSAQETGSQFSFTTGSLDSSL